MLNPNLLHIGIVVSVCAAFAIPQAASAQSKKKVSHAEAWRICKAALDKEGPATSLNTNDRYIRGGACLAKFGYSF
jgi:hypothetical protein